MDFATAPGGNPFLMNDDDFAASADSSMASNPFLSEDFTMPTADPALNPFLMGGDDFQAPADNVSAGTNPFAMFGMEEEPAPPPAMAPAQTVDFFGGAVSQPDFFVPQEPPVQDSMIFSPERPPPPRPAPPPTTAHVPTSLPLAGVVEYRPETTVLVSEEATTVPSRPPPPRPVPPSRETVQLIQTVTGAMEANSSDLLDRLQANRTPSPTPMRDLHSPSPTPDLYNDGQDLLMDSSIAPAPQTSTIEEPQTAANFMDIFGGSGPEPAQEFTHPPETEQQPTQVVYDQIPQITQQSPQAVYETEPQQSPQVPYEPTPQFIPQESYEPTPQFVPQQTQPAYEPTPQFVPQPAPPVYEQIPQVVQQPPAEQPAMQTADLFGLFGDATAPAAPPPRPAPPVVAMTLTPPEDANLIGDLSSPGGFTQPQSTEPPLSFAAEPRRPPPPKVPPRPPSPAAPQPPSTFAQPAFSDKPKPPTVLTPPEQLQQFGQEAPPPEPDEFDSFNDAFSAKFESAGAEKKTGDAFYNAFGATVGGEETGDGAWGNDSWGGDADQTVGFGGEEEQFDSFLAMNAPPPPQPRQYTPRQKRQESGDSDDGTPDFSIVIKPRTGGQDDISPQLNAAVPALAPPPRSPITAAYADDSPRINPFDGQESSVADIPPPVPQSVAFAAPQETGVAFQRTDSQETPTTPLFDDDTSQPLEEFPRVTYVGEGWDMHLRQPNKKKITGQRFWKKVFVKLVYQGDNPVLQLYNTRDDKDPFQELPLQASYNISDIGAQQFDQYGKIFTVKLQFVFYKERPGVRPGQVKKAERITDRLTKFAAYAIQGDYEGCKEFGSDLRKLGLPVEHAPQLTQLLKIGSQDYETMKQFTVTMEEAFFKMPAHRDRALTYKMEEVQITAVDELYLEQDKLGHVGRQIARVRIFFLGFINGMPDLELGVNDINRQGKEVVGRHDIIPVKTEEWIRLENLEFHSCVLNSDYEGDKVIKFKPPDASYIELLRFRVRPPKNRELPLQTKCTFCVQGNRVEIKCDILVPGFSSRKLGQIPCEDIMLRIPIPESWIYLFRVEKHFRYGSVKSAHRRTGKVKGLERILGAVETLDTSLIEVTSGSAKYEHQHHAIVWRINRLPKEGQGAYTNHEFVCKFTLTSHDQIPDELAQYCYLEFTMPSTQASHTTVRSLSVLGDRDEDPPEKCVRHLVRCEYRVEVDHIQPAGVNEYTAATRVKPKEEPVAEVPEKDSDSDSSS